MLIAGVCEVTAGEKEPNLHDNAILQFPKFRHIFSQPIRINFPRNTQNLRCTKSKNVNMMKTNRSYKKQLNWEHLKTKTDHKLVLHEFSEAIEVIKKQNKRTLSLWKGRARETLNFSLFAHGSQLSSSQPHPSLSISLALVACTR